MIDPGVATTSSTDSQGLNSQVDQILAELAELGTEIKIEGGETIVTKSQLSIDIRWRQIIFQQDKVTAYEFSQLILLCDDIIFRQGLSRLRTRIEALGWTATDDYSGCPTRTVVDVGKGSKHYYGHNQTYLRHLQDDVEFHEHRNSLRTHKT